MTLTSADAIRETFKYCHKPALAFVMTNVGVGYGFGKIFKLNASTCIAVLTIAAMGCNIIFATCKFYQLKNVTRSYKTLVLGNEDDSEKMLKLHEDALTEEARQNDIYNKTHHIHYFVLIYSSFVLAVTIKKIECASSLVKPLIFGLTFAASGMSILKLRNKGFVF